MTSDLELQAVRRAIEIAGGQQELAQIAGVTPQAISHANIGKSRFPIRAGAVLKVEAATGVSRHDLRPDIYPREDRAPDQQQDR